MRQLLLRVPDELHARLTARAAREGTSVNQLANQILDTAADVDRGTRTDRLRATAAARGVLVSLREDRVTDSERRAALRGMTGLGRILDRVLDEDRERG